MKISCEIIRDLLPLYHDNVCSKESRKLVREHLEHCTECTAELDKMDVEIKGVTDIDDMKPIHAIADKWKSDKKTSFLIGIMVISLLSSIGCGIAYHSIGSYVAEDGMLVEPFALIPLSFLFGLIALLSSIILGIRVLIKHIKHKKLKV